MSLANCRFRAALIVLLAGTLLVALVEPAAASTEERRIQSTRAQLEEVRQQIEAAEREKAEDQERLAQAEEQLAEVQRAVGEAEQAVERQHQAVEKARAELEEYEADLEEKRDQLAHRAVDRYRQGSGVPFEAVLRADSPADALQRSAYVDAINRSDQRNVEGLDASVVAVDAQREVLQEEEAALERVLEEQRGLMAEVEEIRQTRAIALAESEGQVASLEAEEEHLVSEQRELEAIARRQAQEDRAARARQEEQAQQAEQSSTQPQQQQQSSQPSQSSREPAPTAGGGWQWPASGPVTSGYGQRWGRMHQGIDIGGSTGSAIVAARGGTVSYVGTMGGYGNMVMVNHGGGIMTAYAHLSSFSVSGGQSVSQGQRLGGMGCTGSCTGTHLHFEVRVNGSAQNPRNYLP